MIGVETTPSQTVGPFFSFGLCVRPENELVPRDDPDGIVISGHVYDGDGAGVPDSMVEIWQADAEGTYRGDFGWGRCGTDREGAFSFVAIKPGPVPGANGGLQAPHLTMLVFARGMLKPVHTRLYFPDEEEANEADFVLAGIPDAADRATLIAEPDGTGALRFDVRLQGDGQTAFFAV
jgi:protocatechuate 3,4-dioxygenase alpha subunit